MKFFICTDHDLHYPVGCASVVIAETEEKAVWLLDRELKLTGLKPSSEVPYTLKEIQPHIARAYILNDGDY